VLRNLARFEDDFVGEIVGDDTCSRTAGASGWHRHRSQTRQGDKPVYCRQLLTMISASHRRIRLFQHQQFSRTCPLSYINNWFLSAIIFSCNDCSKHKYQLSSFICDKTADYTHVNNVIHWVVVDGLLAIANFGGTMAKVSPWTLHAYRLSGDNSVQSVMSLIRNRGLAPWIVPVVVFLRTVSWFSRHVAETTQLPLCQPSISRSPSSFDCLLSMGFVGHTCNPVVSKASL